EAAEDVLEDLPADVVPGAAQGPPHRPAPEASGAEGGVGPALAVGVLLLEDAPERLARQRAHEELREDRADDAAVRERRAGHVVLPAGELAAHLLELREALAVGLGHL